MPNIYSFNNHNQEIPPAQLSFDGKSTTEIIDILNYIPDLVAYLDLRFSEKLIPDLPYIFSCLKWGERLITLHLPPFTADINNIVSYLPPRVRVNDNFDWLPVAPIQLRAREAMHVLLKQIEINDEELQDSILQALLKNNNFWNKLFLSYERRPLHSLNVIAANLGVIAVYNYTQLLVNSNMSIDDIEVPEESALYKILENPEYFPIVMQQLEDIKTPMAYLCAALLLSQQMPCFFEKKMTPADNDEYSAKRNTDALNFFFKASKEKKLLPISRQGINKIKTAYIDATLYPDSNITQIINSFLYNFCLTNDREPRVMIFAEKKERFLLGKKYSEEEEEDFHKQDYVQRHLRLKFNPS